MIFLFGSSLGYLEPDLQLDEVWEIMVRQIISTIIANVISSNSGSRWAREEPKKRKSAKYNFQDDGHISLTPVVHVQLQEGLYLTSKYAKNRRFGVKSVKISKPKKEN